MAPTGRRRSVDESTSALTERKSKECEPTSSGDNRSDPSPNHSRSSFVDTTPLSPSSKQANASRRSASWSISNKCSALPFEISCSYQSISGYIHHAQEDGKVDAFDAVAEVGVLHVGVQLRFGWRFACWLGMLTPFSLKELMA